jgi:hypothetical protein
MPASRPAALGTSTILAAAFACAAGLAVNLWVAVNSSAGFGVDFNQFYSASRLAGTGHLYDWDALRKIEAERGGPVRTGRLPVVAFGVKLIGWMPFPVARAVWLAGGLVSLLVFVFAWPGMNRLVAAVAVCWSMPAALVLVLGQDLPFWLMFVSAGLLWLSRGRPRLAGGVFTLCICKYHLALGLPVLLAAQKRWNALVAASATGAVLLGACFWIEGPAWPLRYWKALADPGFSPALARMANLRGIAWWLPWPGAVEVVLAIAVAVLFWWFCRRTTDLGFAGAGAAAAGMLLGRHGQAGDFALLIPLLVFTLQRPGVPAWLKYWAVVLVTPVPTLLVVTSKPFFGQIAVVGFVVAALLRECLVRKTAAGPDASRALPA